MDDPRPGEADKRPGRGGAHVSERAIRRVDPTGGRRSDQGDLEQPGLGVVDGGGRRPRHLDERNHSLLQPGSARCGHDHDWQAGVPGALKGAYDPLAVGGAH